MGQLVFQATAGGQVALVGPNPTSNFSLNVPAVNGNLVTTGDTGTVTNTMLASSAYTAPGTIGSGTPNSGAFTTLSASSTVSGTGFSTYLASPPAIGGTSPSTGKFTSITNTGLTSGYVVFAGTGGLESGSANLTFNGTTLGVTGSITSSTSLTTPLINSGSGNNLTLQTSGTTALFADTSQNIFTASQFGVNTIASGNWRPFSINTTSEWPIGVRQFNATTSARITALFQKSLGGSYAAPVAVNQNTYLGGLSMSAYDGTTWRSGYDGGAEILANASENWTSSNHGTELLFYITPNGTSGDTPALKIANNSNLQFITSNAGIVFNNSSALTNSTLNDYETGSWTPNIQFGGGQTGLTYTTQVGSYTKIGNSVTVYGQINIATVGSSSGVATISNLPFSASGNPYGIGSIAFDQGATSITSAGFYYGIASASTLYIRYNPSSGLYQSLTNSNFVSGTQIYFSITYRTSF